MIGKQISHYKIISKIGRGGMGEVYLAEDTRLGRQVALKFLPEHFRTDQAARDRLLREATAASKLSHANIVALYDIGESDGYDFIVMEYVSGRSLREIISSGELTTDKSIDITRQICNGLKSAHEKGIVHRDIKSDNIVVTDDGTVKILDFGLATFEGAIKLTGSTSTVGTLAYMSPEQTRGEEVDQRSDLFSAGILLYEMIAGRQPFTGDHGAAVTYAIVNEEPEPLARYKANVPEEIQRIVDKLLSKDRETRYQTAAGVLSDLGALQTTAPAAPARRPRRGAVAGLVVAVALIAVVVGYFGTRLGDRTRTANDTGRIMIAVLPFENMGPAEDDYFADGITEEITARLASIHGLGVIARTSILRYKGTQKDVQQIADELNVDFVLEGTVRWQRAGDGPSRVRVTPQLIRATDATHVWASVYDEPLTAVFDVQTNVAVSVTQELNVALLEPERRSVEARPTDNLEAYDYYLRGREYLYERQELGQLWFAEGLFLKAVELDPEFADAWALLSTVHSSLYWFAEDRTDRRVALASDAINRAVTLDPNSFVTRMSLGYQYYQGELDYGNALEQFEKAKQLQPGSMEPYAAIGYVKRRQGRWEECLDNLMYAHELDPRSSELAYEIGETLTDLGRYDEAEKYLDRSIEFAPDQMAARIWKFWMYIYQGDLAKARTETMEAPFASGFRILCGALLYSFENEHEKSLARLRDSQMRALSTHFNFIPIAQMMAHGFLALGEPDSARAYFDSSRVQMEALIATQPDDARYHSALGIAYAGLGRKHDAIREGKRGVELMPVSKEAKRGPRRRGNLAVIYTLVGEYDAAIDEIEYLLTIPASPARVPLLRMDPRWDPLRDHPRFQKLVE